jgi:hypothetical protein
MFYGVGTSRNTVIGGLYAGSGESSGYFAETASAVNAAFIQPLISATTYQSGYDVVSDGAYYYTSAIGVRTLSRAGSDGNSVSFPKIYTDGIRLTGFGSGTLMCDSNGDVYSSSDVRLKDDVRPFVDGLEVLRSLTPIRFRWAKESGLNTSDCNIGFSAQDVQAVMPAAVGVGASGKLSLDDRAIVAAAVNAIQELDRQLAELKARIVRLGGDAVGVHT